MGIAAVAAAIFISGISFAEGDEAAKVKVMEDSAAALQGSNPDLAKGLGDLAAEEARTMRVLRELRAKDEAKIKLLDDSAAALEKTDPDLAKGLKETAEKMRAGKRYE
jgi:hypothetical protein